MNKFLPILAFTTAAAAYPALADASVARMSTPANYQIITTSRNDKWGAGYIGDGSSGETGGFRWNLITGKIDNVGTLNDAGGIAVDNNGVIYACHTTVDANGVSSISPGYYKDGKWHDLPIPEGFSGGGLDACCSSDGRFVAMTLDSPEGYLTPVVWRDGVPFVVKTNGSYCRVSSITEDGSMIGGWMNTDNRHNTIWTFDGEGYNDYMHPGNTPKWTDNVMGFSSDNRYALVDDGWDYDWTEDEGNCRYFGIYDLQEKEMLPIIAPDTRGSDIYIFNMSGDRHCIGSYSGTAMLVTPDRNAHLLSDWLKENHDIDVHDFSEIITYENVFRLAQGMTVNDGASRFGFIYYGSYKDVEDYYPFYSMYLVLDADPDDATPLELKASKMPGINAVSLEWEIPFACEREIKGYDIYRDGVKVNSEPVAEKSFYDREVGAGAHRYSVRAVFEGGESPLSEEIEFTMEDALAVNPPQLLTARQRGFNRVDLNWAAPKFNSGYLAYFDTDSNTEGIGTTRNDITMEVGVLYPEDLMDLYKGASLKSVSFTPMSECDSWKVVIYRPTVSGVPREVYSQAITQDIKPGEENVIELDTPYEVEGKNLIIALQAYSKNANVRLFGYQQGKAKPGYSDLIRMYDSSNLPFDSFYNISEEVYASPMEVCWKISGNFVPQGVGSDVDDIKSYSVFEDGVEVATPSDNSVILGDIAGGKHIYAVRANYGNGATSGETTIALDVNLDDKALPVAAPEWKYDTETGQLEVKWQAPADDDATYVTYAEGPINAKFVPNVPGTNELYAAAIYPSNSYKTYKGYEIRGIGFTPGCEADFSYEVLKDGEVIADGEVADYTIGQWTEIAFGESIAFDPLADYEVRLNAYDFEEGKGPFLMSVDPVVPDRGDLISIDGEEWSTVQGLNGQSYNWMIRMNIAERDNASLMPIRGYDVVLDDEPANPGRIEEKEYSFKTSKTGSMPLRVDAWYPGIDHAINGEEIFIILETDAVEGVEALDVDIRGGKGCIIVKGEGITAVEVADIDGRIIARGSGAKARIDSIPAGIYVVKAVIDGNRAEIAKINVN